MIVPVIVVVLASVAMRGLKQATTMAFLIVVMVSLWFHATIARLVLAVLGLHESPQEKSQPASFAKCPSSLMQTWLQTVIPKHRKASVAKLLSKLLLHMLAAFAEFEHGLIVERVRAGVTRAQAKGIHCGRPRRDIDLRVVEALMGEGRSVRETASIIGVPRSTLQRRLREMGKGGPKVTAITGAENSAPKCQQALPEDPA